MDSSAAGASPQHVELGGGGGGYRTTEKHKEMTVALVEEGTIFQPVLYAYKKLVTMFTATASVV
jgi:hypothetical protein